jgi:hypothetical protein
LNVQHRISNGKKDKTSHSRPGIGFLKTNEIKLWSGATALFNVSRLGVIVRSMFDVRLSSSRFYCLLFFLLLLIGSLSDIALAGDCREIVFEHKPSDYYGSGEYFMTCPGEGDRIRCYHYHRHWVCEKGDTLYWDRRLESAARTACGCNLPSDTAPASPATSGKTRENIFSPQQ